MAIPPIAQEIIRDLQDIQETPPRPGVITLSDWSDQKLEDLSILIKVSNAVKNLNSYKSFLYHFYNFYFNGIIPMGGSPHNIIYPFLSSLSYGVGAESNYYISNEFFDRTGFFNLPPLLQEIPIIVDSRVAAAGQHIPQTLVAEQRQELERLYLTQEDPDKALFLNSINHLIRSFDSQNMTMGNISILKLTGFLALLLFRGISKDAIQLARGVNKKLIKEHIHNLAGWPIANSYYPPCKTCVDNCSIDFNKGNAHANKMMTLLLVAWKRANETQSETYGLQPQVQAALLTHTAGNGLGLIMMLYNSCESLGVTISTLMKHTLTEQSSASWRVLSSFLKKYLDKDHPQRTYMWARLISDGYFTEFAARAHPYLAGMFAGIIGSTQTIGSIKEAAWFVQKQHQAELGFAWGKAVVAKLAQTVDVPILAEGVEVSSFVERVRPGLAEQPLFDDFQVDPFEGVPIENGN